MPENLTQHKLDLSKELVDDIELFRLAPEQLLLKAYRLARLVEDADIQRWLKFELEGYKDSELGRKHMSKMGRWINESKRVGYWGPLARLNGAIRAAEIQLQQLQVPHVHFSPSSSNPNEYVTGFAGSNVDKLSGPSKAVLEKMKGLADQVVHLSDLRSRVISAVHEFSVATYHGLAFSGFAESIFEQHQNAVDELLQEHAPDVLEKVPSIYARLGEGDEEAISQGLNSCRRMMKVFADAVYPPDERTVKRNGTSYQVGSDKVLNRIKCYLIDNCPSDSRVERLSKTIRFLHERASAGAHAQVDAGEAKSVFLQTYVVLGEILEATRPRSHSTPRAETLS